MTIMAPLPDGTFLIMGGAEAGVAGFGLANTPNLQAILYDPTQPRNQRFSILGETIVARLYHSEATLLNVSQPRYCVIVHLLIIILGWTSHGDRKRPRR